MISESVRKYIDSMRSKDTQELLHIWKDGDHNTYPAEAFEAISLLLTRRSVPFTPQGLQRERQALAAERAWLPSHSNAMVRTLDSGDVQLSFPKDGFIIPDRADFRSHEDLRNYISEILSLPHLEESHRIPLMRVGQYQRMDHRGQPIFTFGDPILDLITDEHGWITIGDERHDLRAFELSEPSQRTGGILSIDLLPYQKDIERIQLVEAVLGSGRFTLEHCSSTHVVFASRNPSEKWFHSDGSSMRFRAWKKSYSDVIWKLGADIQTWNGNFSGASILAQGGMSIGGTTIMGQHVCQIIEMKQAVANNGNYLSSHLTFPSLPFESGVRANIIAQWKGNLCSGTLENGSCGSFFV